VPAATGAVVAGSVRAMTEPVFFDSPQAWRDWLAEHHDSATEVWVGYHKRMTGRPSLTWQESVQQALCFGWIDGVRRSAGPDAYTIRFSPRRPASIWSAVNVATYAELERRGLVEPAGRAAFARRREDRTGVYSFENRADARLAPEQETRFRADATAWAFFTSRPPSYRTAAIWWVVSARREDTRERRLGRLIADSAAGRTIPPLTRP
jgi:uncharacterized protein YdeI (YjbR/CyaY-like superfamily)